MKKKLMAGLAVGVMMLGIAGVANATTQTFDFEGGGTSTEGYAAHGFGNYYLWSSGAVVSQSFTQSGGSTIDLSFNLAVIDTWDGNDPNIWWASPDIFNVELDGNLIFSESFNNYDINNQSYHATSPITLGTNLAVTTSYNDSAYLITLNGLTSTAGQHTLSFYANGSGWQGIGYPTDESFAVDNIKVSDNAPVPEPATMLLMGTGLAGLIGARRKKK